MQTTLNVKKGGLGRLLLSLLLISTAANANVDLQLDGQFQQGGLITGVAPSGYAIKVAGRVLQQDNKGRFVFGINRDAKPVENITLFAADGSQTTQTIDIEKREYKTQRIDGLPPSKVTPKPETYKQIKEDGRLASAARKKDYPHTDVFEQFIWPATGPITGVYGSQRILNGIPKRPHFGVDVAGPVGQPVYAPVGGVVTLVRDMYYSGITMIIDHGFGISSSFLHLSKAHVKQGDRVEQGDLIADIGATGRVTGAHLDWRMNWFKRRIDPQLLAGDMPANNKE